MKCILLVCFTKFEIETSATQLLHVIIFSQCRKLRRWETYTTFRTDFSKKPTTVVDSLLTKVKSRVTVTQEDHKPSKTFSCFRFLLLATLHLLHSNDVALTAGVFYDLNVSLACEGPVPDPLCRGNELWLPGSACGTQRQQAAVEQAQRVEIWRVDKRSDSMSRKTRRTCLGSISSRLSHRWQVL